MFCGLAAYIAQPCYKVLQASRAWRAIFKPRVVLNISLACGSERIDINIWEMLQRNDGKQLCDHFCFRCDEKKLNLLRGSMDRYGRDTFAR